MNMGLPGEGLVNKKVWVVKTHFPERYGSQRYGAERALILVRSPLDCLVSLFNMMCSGSHDCSIEDEDFTKFADVWTKYLEQDIIIWKEFHEWWMKQNIPTHIIRYEDVV